MISNQQSIHCKVNFNGELRRFHFTGTEFTSLYEHVKSLMGLEKEFVLKYKDEEGDMITVSTTEELAFAISCLVPPSVLRLEVVLIEKEEKEEKEDKSCQPRECHKRKKSEWEEKGMRRWEDKGMRKWEGKGMRKWENHKEKLEAKRERIVQTIQRLSSIPPDEGKFEWREKKIAHLTGKLSWIDSALSGNPEEWKHHKKPRCEGRPALSPEKKALLDAAKEKIKSQKEVLYQYRLEIRNRKNQWPETPENQKDELARSIMELKQKMKEAKAVLFELKNEIRQLFHST
jgi:hypothetical protein